MHALVLCVGVYLDLGYWRECGYCERAWVVVLVGTLQNGFNILLDNRVGPICEYTNNEMEWPWDIFVRSFML